MRRAFSFAAAILVLCGLVPSVHADDIAFFYALEQDLAPLKAVSTVDAEPRRVGSRMITRLRVHGHDVDAVKMGSGCVEAALSAQAILACRTYDLAISVGPAGSLAPSVETGQWYRIEKTILWQKGSETSSGFQAGKEQSVSLVAGPAVSLLSITNIRTIAAGEAFISSSSKRAQLQAASGADMVDMNSHGVAAACTDHAVPLVMLRIISDHADEHAPEVFRQFLETYRGDGGSLAVEILAALPANPARSSSYGEIQRVLDQDNP